MAEKILDRCVIVCASPDARVDFIKNTIRKNDFVIAADGGMELLNKSGIIPDIFVGDFDSFHGAIPESTKVIKLNTHKDDTDSMHCASIAAELGFKRTILLGALGGNFSHSFANFGVLSFLCDNNIEAHILSENETVTVVSESTLSLNGLCGTEFSVFPFGCDSVVVSYDGEVEYPAFDLEIVSSGTLGKSNLIKGDYLDIIVEKGKAIIFSSKKEL